MPVSATRSSTGLRPGWLKRRGGWGGNSGTIKAHKSSSSSGLAISLSRKGLSVAQPGLVHFLRASK